MDTQEIDGAFRKAVSPKRYCEVSHQLTKRAKVLSCAIEQGRAKIFKKSIDKFILI
jgi:hypothetical protein